MVRQTDILTAINKILVAAYPTYTVYVNNCHKDFVRPSFLLEIIKISQVDICRTSIEKTVYFTITCFTKVDKYYNSDQEELADLQDNIINQFNTGYVVVGDRAIKVKASTGGMDTDRSYIDLQFEFVDNRNDEDDTTPLIESVTTNTNLKEE